MAAKKSPSKQRALKSLSIRSVKDWVREATVKHDLDELEAWMLEKVVSEPMTITMFIARHARGRKSSSKKEIELMNTALASLEELGLVKGKMMTVYEIASQHIEDVNKAREHDRQYMPLPENQLMIPAEWVDEGESDEAGLFVMSAQKEHDLSAEDCYTLLYVVLHDAVQSDEIVQGWKEQGYYIHLDAVEASLQKLHDIGLIKPEEEAKPTVH